MAARGRAHLASDLHRRPRLGRAPDPHLSRAQALQKQLFSPDGKNLSPEDRKARFAEYREHVKHLNDDQKWELRRSPRETQKAEMDRYFSMSPAEQARYLDEQIDRSEKLKQAWQKKGGQGKGGAGKGSQAKGRPPGGGFGGNKSSAAKGGRAAAIAGGDSRTGGSSSSTGLRRKNERGWTGSARTWPIAASSAALPPRM